MSESQERDYLNGKRVYRSSSHAPEPGRKDPSGYIRRENQSDKRSGLAAAALRLKDRMQDPQTSQQPLINQTLTPVGNSGLMKDPTGRLYYGSPPQAQA